VSCAACTGTFETYLTVVHLVEDLRWTLQLRGRWPARTSERLCSEVHGEITLDGHAGPGRTVTGNLDVELHRVAPAIVVLHRIALDLAFADRSLTAKTPVGWKPGLGGITVPGQLIDHDITHEIEIHIPPLQHAHIILTLNL